jgi:hypothetical protein
MALPATGLGGLAVTALGTPMVHSRGRKSHLWARVPG